MSGFVSDKVKDTIDNLGVRPSGAWHTIVDSPNKHNDLLGAFDGATATNRKNILLVVAEYDDLEEGKVIPLLPQQPQIEQRAD